MIDIKIASVREGDAVMGLSHSPPEMLQVDPNAAKRAELDRRLLLAMAGLAGAPAKYAPDDRPDAGPNGAHMLPMAISASFCVIA